MYESLDSTQTQIRVLELHPGSPGNVVSCKTRVVSLHSNPRYTALSYTWGDPSVTKKIQFNGKADVLVTVNLAAALLRLREPAETVTLWVDALCINQGDNEEKSQQVGLMGDIYSSAEETCIWLGEESDNSDLAFEAIGQLNGDNHESPQNDLDETSMLAIASIQKRAWWSRVWVVQGKLCSLQY